MTPNKSHIPEEGCHACEEEAKGLIKGQPHTCHTPDVEGLREEYFEFELARNPIAKEICEWWLSKIKSLLSHQEASLKEKIEKMCSEYCKEDVVLKKNKPYDWHGYSHACRDVINLLSPEVKDTK